MIVGVDTMVLIWWMPGPANKAYDAQTKELRTRAKILLDVLDEDKKQVWAGPFFWSRGYESTVWVTGKGLDSGVRLCGCRSEAVGRTEAAAQPAANSAGVRYPSEL